MLKMIEELKELLENVEYHYSNEAIETLKYLIEELEYHKEEERNIDLLEHYLNQIINESFIYYDDAHDYLKGNRHNDISDATNEGYYTITGIATYYLNEEVLKLLREFSY